MKHCTIRERATGRTATVPLPLAHALVMAGKHEYTDKRRAKRADVSALAPAHDPLSEGMEKKVEAETADAPAKKAAKKRAYKRRDLKAEA